MGRRKEQLIARIVRKMKHIVRPHREYQLNMLRQKLHRFSAKRLARWAQNLERCFDRWDQTLETAKNFYITGSFLSSIAFEKQIE